MYKHNKIKIGVILAIVAAGICIFTKAVDLFSLLASKETFIEQYINSFTEAFDEYSGGMSIEELGMDIN